jgi:hypothetical protein
MMDSLKQLADLSKKRVAALADGNQELVKLLQNQESSLRVALASQAKSPNAEAFEIVRVTEGISLSVHVPTCIGSAIGTIHTHPRFKDSTGDELMPIPSDMDLQFGVHSVILQNQKYALVISNEWAVMLVYTAAAMRYKQPDKVAVKLEEVLQLGSLDSVMVDGIPFRRDTHLPVVSAIAAKMGAGLYAGHWPTLSRVHSPDFLHSPFVDYRDGEFKLGVATARRDLIGTLEVMLFLHPEAEPNNYWFLGQSSAWNWFFKQVSDSPTPVRNFDAPFSHDNFLWANRIFHSLTEPEKITVLGFGRARKDIRHIAKEENKSYSIGPCVFHYFANGAPGETLVSECTADSNQKQNTALCHIPERDVDVAWRWNSEISQVTVLTSKGDGTCRTATYNYLDGQFGDLISKTN